MPVDFWETPLGRQMRGLPPAPPPLWKPTYLTGTVSQPGIGGAVNTQPISSQYLVTKETAYYLAALYGATVGLQPWEGFGGPNFGDAVEYILQWPGFSMNAGMLAYYYCPANGQPAPGALANPDIVVAECNAAINAARMDALRQVR